MTFILQIISEFSNLPASTRTAYKDFSTSLLARTLFSRGNGFANLAKIKFS